MKPPTKNGKKTPMSIPLLPGGKANVRRLDELEKTLASMRKSLGGQTSTAPPIQETFGTTGNFGHPLDMLARTAANTTSPDDRFSTPGGGGSAFNGITPPAVPMQRPVQRVIPSETVPTTWSTELSGIDPVERGWLDIDDAKMLFERYLPPLNPPPVQRDIYVSHRYVFRTGLTVDFGNICCHRCQSYHLALKEPNSNKSDDRNRRYF